MFINNLDLSYGDNLYGLNDSITNVAYEGGGCLGIAYPRAYGVLEQIGIAQHLKNYTGSSAGILFAFLCVLGFTSNEIEKNIKELDLAKLMDTAVLDLPGLINGDWTSYFTLLGSPIDLRNFFYKLGLCYGDKAREWLIQSLKKKNFDENTTFKELYNKTGKGLYVPVTNMSYGRTEVISHEHKSHFKVVDVMLAAMSIHGVFRSVKIENDFYNDGGLSDIYPITLFDELGIEGNTLGLLLNSKEEILNPVRLDNANGVLLLINVIVTLRAALLQQHFKDPKNIDRSIFIDTFGINMLNFNISDEQKEKLLESGKTAVLNYFGMMNENNSV